MPFISGLKGLNHTIRLSSVQPDFLSDLHPDVTPFFTNKTSSDLAKKVKPCNPHQWTPVLLNIILLLVTTKIVSTTGVTDFHYSTTLNFGMLPLVKIDHVM